MDKLIISKSIRSDYKNPKQIAHKVLADRITARDPGNKPASGDRIPYVYIHNPKRGALQGDKIETPAIIVENKLKIDYGHYITNQVMKPVQQVFASGSGKDMDDAEQAVKTESVQGGRGYRWRQSERSREVPRPLGVAPKNREIKALLFDHIYQQGDQPEAGDRMR